MKVFLTLSAVFLSACVIRVVSPPPATPQPYQIVYEEAEVQPVIIKQVIIKRERRKIIPKIYEAATKGEETTSSAEKATS